jgi:hypothetical protein
VIDASSIYLLKLHQFVAFAVTSRCELCAEKSSEMFDLGGCSCCCDGRVGRLEGGRHLFRKEKHRDQDEVNDIADRQFADQIRRCDVDRRLIVRMGRRRRRGRPMSARRRDSLANHTAVRLVLVELSCIILITSRS